MTVGRTDQAGMPNYVGALTIVLLLGMVLSQVFSAKGPGDQSDEVREHRRDGFPDPSLRILLLLCPVRDCVRLAQRRGAPIFPFRGCRRGWRPALPRGLVVLLWSL